MKIAEVIAELENFAPLSLQESYDNAGLITGNLDWHCTGALCALDSTEDVIKEAQQKNCNLVIAHHPIIFNGIKKITGRNYVEKTIIAAIKNDIAIYAIHTNLDNILKGVNDRIADKLELIDRKILLPKSKQLLKLFTFIPVEYLNKVRDAIFAAGAGNIGNYSECSFNVQGKGTFKAKENTHPFVGEIGKRHEENEVKIEIIFPIYLQKKIIAALLQAHPYEEVAYDIISLENIFENTGIGLIGELPEEISETDFLHQLKNAFHLSLIKHTNLRGKKVKKVALCGGSGQFLLSNALNENADFYITSDIKYHQFFDANDKIIIADIGHWESEQFTIDLLFDILRSKFPNFAVQKTSINTNPVNYFL